MTLRISPLPPESANFDIVAVGENSVDFVGVKQAGAQWGTKNSLDEFSVCPGGQAATAAVGCARLGLRTRYVGVLGRDSWGGMVEAALLRESVDLVAVWRATVPTRTAVVLVSSTSGERTVLSHRHAGLTLTAAERPVGEALAGRVLLLDAVDPGFSEAVARAARARGIPTILDVDAPGPGVEEVLAQTDIMVVPEGFPEAMTGASGLAAAAGELMSRFDPAALVVTLGADGALAMVRGREWRVKAVPVAAKDTTGAGDAFRAGLAAGWLELGSAAPLDELLRYAAVVAALNCREMGAQTGLPTRAELDPYL